MYKHLFPNLNGGGKPLRSATPKNLDTVFNALLLLTNVSGTSWANRMVTAISLAFSRVQGLMLGEPKAVITQLKLFHKQYFEWIRGGPRPLTANVESVNTISGPGPIPAMATIVESFVSLREAMWGSSFTDITWYDQIVLTFLSIHRVIVLPPEYDFSTITNPCTVDLKEIEKRWSKEHITKLLHKIGILVPEFKRILESKCRAQEHIIMSSAGPNGKASWSAFSDAKAWLYKPEFLSLFVNWCEGLHMGRFVRDILRTVRIPSQDVPEATQLHLGRIHTFEEWGGKTRHVAIVDYWTQLIFTPLHDTLFEYLRGITMDATYNQDAACNVIKAWTMNEKSEINCFDLTAATDRLPLTIQQRVLAVLLGSDSLASNWAKILVDRDYPTANGEFVQYKVGAPMGSKSNWAMLALLHHLIIQDAALEAGFTAPFTMYRVCGDDSVINSNTVSEKYKAIMSSLGLTINTSKSVLSGKGLLPAAEFCKRLFISGVEYTILPVKLLAKTVMNGRLAPQLQSEMTRRWLTLKGSGMFTFIAGLVDVQSIQALGILNSLPLSLTGLHSKITLPSLIPTLQSWWAGRQTTEHDITQAYTYTLIVDQLQRLDTLLRQTDIIANAIRNVSAGYSTIDLKNLGWTEEFMKSKVGQTLLTLQGELDIFHPIVQASKAEYTRIVNLLAAITNGDKDINSAARARMLDEFRNTLVSVWDSEDAAVGQADRTLLEKSLDNLDRIIHMDGHTLQFTTQLSYLQRIYSVQWLLSENVTINSVASKVKSIPTVAETQIEKAFASNAFVIDGRWASKRAIKTTTSSTPIIEDSPAATVAANVSPATAADILINRNSS